jgi:hypothetical protein
MSCDGSEALEVERNSRLKRVALDARISVKKIVYTPRQETMSRESYPGNALNDALEARFWPTRKVPHSDEAPDLTGVSLASNAPFEIALPLAQAGRDHLR